MAGFLLLKTYQVVHTKDILWAALFQLVKISLDLTKAVLSPEIETNESLCNYTFDAETPAIKGHVT